jgi:hypothetical protein
MPIRPIDLQTLLMQMSQVGRDQAVEKDGPVLQSAIQGAVAQRKEIETRESVRRTEDAQDGTPPIKDKDKRTYEQGRERGGGEDQGEADAGEKTPDEVVRDPSLGNRVDLTG